MILLKVEICNEHACIMSNITKGTTAEALPQGITRPSVRVDSAEAVTVTWGPPTNPNGIILRYELMRRTNLPCHKQ